MAISNKDLVKRLRRGFGRAKGTKEQLNAYQNICNEAACLIEGADAYINELEGAIAMNNREIGRLKEQLNRCPTP